MVVDLEVCRCCQGGTDFLSDSKILNYEAKYTVCRECKSIQVDSPHWLDEAHTNAISQFDTGLVSRSMSASRLIGSFLKLQNDSNIKGLDWGGGTGLLTRLLRDLGIDAYSYDKYAAGDLSHGFVVTEEVTHREATFISAIECFEHLPNPIATFAPLVKNKKYFIFTTEVLPNPVPNPADNDWWYFMPESGQHVTFASLSGLNEFRKQMSFEYYLRLGSLHIFSREKFRLVTVLVMKLKILRWIHTHVVLYLSSRSCSLTVNDRDSLLRQFKT